MRLGIIFGRLCPILAMLTLLSPGLTVHVAAQSPPPASVNPTASSVREQQLLEALKPEVGRTSAVTGRVSIPDKSSGNLIQPAGRDWRALQEETLPKVALYSIGGALAALILFFLVRGRLRLASGFSGITVLRFNALERFAHWLASVSFILLGLTGLNVAFGKRLILPWIGPEAFTALAQAGKMIHNYISFAFALGVLLMFLFWIKDNIPHPRDLVWLFKGGGVFGGHVAATRFNAGQKLIFWTVVLGGIGLSVTGYIMMFPFVWTDIAGMQLATIVHGLLGVVMVAVILVHIYIGTLGMEGAFPAMATGQVDLNWAREHHDLWAEQFADLDTDKSRLTAGRPVDLKPSRPAPAE